MDHGQFRLCLLLLGAYDCLPDHDESTLNTAPSIYRFTNMSFRGTESPMDFEWQRHHGPVDVTSPFHRYAMESSKKRKSALPESTTASNVHVGTHGQIDSPGKTNVPSLIEPNSKPWFFSSAPISPPDQSQYRAPSFTTPRKPVDLDFSSGPETSPADQADNEETPDAKPFEFTSGSVKPTSKRNSLFGMYGKFAPSPARVSKPYNDALERRIHKRRRRAQNFDSQVALARRTSDDTSSDEVGALTKSSHDPRSFSKAQPQYQYGSTQSEGWLRSTFTFLTTYPDAPAILAKYLQIFFNFVIFSSIFYMLYSFYATIRADVDRASDEAMSEVLSEMAQCSKNYVDNRCGADARLPALETVCSNWELCMNRDPSAVKRARLSAHTFAEILNSFVEPISLKTMAFASTLVILSIVVNNVTFTFFRRQYEQHHHHQPTNYAHPYPNHPSGSFQHPAVQMGHHPTSPGFQQQLSWDNNQTIDGNQRRLEYNRSPSKGHLERDRSRSPQKTT